MTLKVMYTELMTVIKTKPKMSYPSDLPFVTGFEVVGHQSTLGRGSPSNEKAGYLGLDTNILVI